MKEEISAGGVIIRNVGKAYEVLLLKDMNNAWTFPKGLIEIGEDPQSAAIREISEEVGLTNVKYNATLPKIEYFYQRNGKIHKTVHYFLFTYTGHEIPKGQIEEGIKDVVWMSFEKALIEVGYSQTNQPLLKKAQELVLKA